MKGILLTVGLMFTAEMLLNNRFLQKEEGKKTKALLYMILLEKHSGKYLRMKMLG